MTILFAPGSGVTITSEANTGLHGRWFRAFLTDRGVQVADRCPFARSLATLDRFVGYVVAGGPPAMALQDMYDLASDAIGADFMTKAIHRTILQTAEPFAGYWREFSVADAIQTRRGKHSKSRDLLWELLVAALVADYGTDVVPGEPDLHATYLGRRWGVACKCFYTHDRDRQVEAIVEGAKQLERAPVDRGIVAVNLANVYPHLELFRYDFPTSSDALQLVQKTQARYMLRFGKLLGSSRLALGGDGTRDKTRSVIFFCPVVVNIDGRPSLYCHVAPLSFRAVQHEEDRFVGSFLKAAATALGHPAPSGLP